MYRYFLAVWLVVISAPLLAHPKLDKADKFRLADPQLSASLLAQIDIADLEKQEQFRYRYIKIYLSTFEGDLKATLAEYLRLLEDMPVSSLRVRVLQSTLSIASYAKEWRTSFELADQLDNLLEQINDPVVEPEAYKGLLLFYKNVEQSDIALVYAARILNHENAGLAVKCFARTMRNEINLERGTADDNAFHSAINLCRDADEPYYVSFNTVHLFEYYLQENELRKASVIAKDALKKVDDVDFIYLRSSFLIAYARLKAAQQNTVQAEQLARQVVSLDPEEQYKDSLIKAYKLLSEIAVEQNAFEAAYEYTVSQNRLESSFHNEHVAQSLAIQQARFDLRNKENQIELLDKRNALLTTESKLVREQVQSMIMALIIAVIAVMSLLYWSFRTRRLQARLRTLATTDALTGVYNRGFFADKGRELLKNASSSGKPVALIFFDLDHFKRINDTHGHQVGDWVLREVVNTVSALCVVNKHYLGRIGGEEFGVLLDNSNIDTAMLFAEKCRQAIHDIDTHISGYHFLISASFGVSDSGQVGHNLDNLFAASDLALYQSKKYGRNQVCLYEANESA